MCVKGVLLSGAKIVKIKAVYDKNSTENYIHYSPAFPAAGTSTICVLPRYNPLLFILQVEQPDTLHGTEGTTRPRKDPGEA